MLKIGYVRPDGQGGADETARLRALGCNVVRVEDAAASGEARSVLGSILDFIGRDDQLVTPHLAHLGRSAGSILEVLERLDEQGATLLTAEPHLSSQGAEGRVLRAALQALAALEPAPAASRRRAPTREILALQRAGVGPAEIARRLGVSRMTVWRKLRAVEA